MSRGTGWWGTAPMMVGAIGLLLLAFGARWFEGAEEINARAQAQAEIYERALRRATTLEEREDILAGALDLLKRAGKTPDPKALAFDKQSDVDPDMASRVHDLIYDAFCDHRDPTAVIAGRAAFYGGLVLMLAAGVLLYRRTPDSARGEW